MAEVHGRPVRHLQLPDPLAEALRWSLAVLAWLIVMAVGSSTAVALSPSGLGSSHTAAASLVSAREGALFSGSITSTSHYCSASVVDSPGGDVIITAAHCLPSSPGSTVFVPGYRNGQAPYGVWPVLQTVESTNWTANTDPDYDVAFGVLGPLHGQEIEQVVGANQLGVNLGTNQVVTLTGYPDGAGAPITCSNNIAMFGSTQMRIACASYTDGTSGSPWVIPGSLGRTHNEGTVLGVIGGFEQGGYTPNVSYSVYFDNSVSQLYQQAIAMVR